MKSFPLNLLFVLACSAPPQREVQTDSPDASAGAAQPAAPATPQALPSESTLAAARAARDAGDHDGARALVAEAIEDLLSASSAAAEERVVRHGEELGRFAHDAGELQSARRVREWVLAVRTRTLPDEHPDLQRARLSLAVTIKALGDLPGARALEEQVLAVLTRTLPDEHPDLQAARSNLATTIQALGDLSGARALEEQVLAIRTRTLPDEHPDLQRARLNLARTIKALGDLPGARALEEQVLAIRTRTLPDEHPDLQRARMNLATTIRALGDLRGARALFEQVLAVRTRTLPDEHPDLQRARLNMAASINELGDPQGARALLEQVLAIRTRTLPDDHPDLQATRGNLAVTMKALGDLQGARALEEHVLAARMRTLPEEHPELQVARLNLAGTIHALGDLPGARALLEQVVAVYTRTLPGEHPHLQAARGSLAGTIKALGDLPGARALEEQVLTVFTRTLPDEHPDLQVARSNLAVTLVGLGDLPGARALDEHVLAIRTRTLPDENPDLQRARFNLAATIYDLGDLQGARALFDQVLKVCTRTLPDEHPDMQATRGNLAATLKALGDVSGARALEEQALAAFARTLPDAHPHLQLVRSQLSWTRGAQVTRSALAAGAEGVQEREGARETCTQLLLAAQSGLLQGYDHALAFGAPREVEEAAVAGSNTLNSCLTFTLGFGSLGAIAELTPASFELSESTRASAVRAAAWQRRAAGSERYSELRSRVRRASDELARVAQSGAEREAFHAARSESEEAQRKLATLARELLGGWAMRVTVDALARALAPKDAVVAYRRFWRHDVYANAGDSPQAPLSTSATDSLCAFVVRPSSVAGGSALTLVPLGPIAAVEREVVAWRNAFGAAEGRGLAAASKGAQETGTAMASNGAPGDKLRALLLDPLDTALGDARRIVVVHDDMTNLVPLDALPQADGGLVGDRLWIEVRNTLAELLESRSEPAPGGIALALGDARFDAQPREHGEEAEFELPDVEPQSVQVASVLRGSVWDSGFTALAYTGPEARGVAELWSLTAQVDHGAVVLAGAEASRSSLVQLAPRARWLHVATHGWHAPESVKSFEDVVREQGEGVGALRASAQDVVKGMSPMLLCGLALAGANLPEDAVGRAPGLLTAEEMSALDLSNCELAVLSACDTNVGLRKSGQGVASFQRALQMAGARSVITSLWKVPDEATRELMLDFYRRIWVEKQPKWKALWDAKMAIRNAKDERGNPKYSTRDWAAWVLTGEPE